MQVGVLAVGRLRAGPKRDLVEDYLTRAARSGRSLGFSAFDVIEVDGRKGGGMAAEAVLLRKTRPTGSVMVALDERGRTLTSPKFADTLAGWRDAGHGHATFVIGGADGLARDFVAEADQVLSFGTMVWPHMLVRVMLAEQLYRAMSILAGAPYHRI
ncbi:23S rRNA (pseudouridine(1915)-N(3))-methyltransferase RlmH [Actibacterium sp. 188UL27-1]|uniref:23S rRNA (pseudouridine(1915)-N(3))-methyltransferase RlmH n=1 Tax=Actibacterium sp. 188UL27-1 TaxID=2786961 RepID=UPI001956D35E|nr:23S rRNA (pseudouridine(1915)-N(3))-methyltransferase RlmH [Actibacterium sp. 188UL27-1]MBM7067075.1 23S rRNA (pseudouridine(1915)-N(3))-methyltransferase RlmH [Actibacterium sp. 188UL27-1]